MHQTTISVSESMIMVVEGITLYELLIVVTSSQGCYGYLFNFILYSIYSSSSIWIIFNVIINEKIKMRRVGFGIVSFLLDNYIDEMEKYAGS